MITEICNEKYGISVISNIVVTVVMESALSVKLFSLLNTVPKNCGYFCRSPHCIVLIFNNLYSITSCSDGSAAALIINTDICVLCYGCEYMRVDTVYMCLFMCVYTYVYICGQIPI